MLRVPFMAAESDMDQLNMIFTALGTPTEQDWPVRCADCAGPAVHTEWARRLTWVLAPDVQGFTKLSSSAQFEKKPRSDLGMLFSAASPEAIDLLQKTLTYDPRRRITAREVRFFPVEWFCSHLSRADRRIATDRPSVTPSSTPPLARPPPLSSRNPKRNSPLARFRPRRLAHPWARRTGGE